MATRREPLALRLKRLRDAAGLTQQELANRAGLSISAVVQIEGGRKNDPRLSTLHALALGLGVPVTELIVSLEEGTPETAPKRRGKKA